jgi:tetratricopeptide (TPR) repeat protein
VPGLAGALKTEEHADLICERVAAAIGAGGTPGSAEETHWAIRRLLEVVAAERPLIVVLEDIHWAEATFLDLIEYAAAFSSTSPILLLCVARPELLDQRPSWSTPRDNASLLVLAPLSEMESSELVESLSAAPLPDSARERIVEVADGNPLFLEQLVAMQTDASEGELLVPATLQALLAVRVAGLPADERCALERASVEGRHFHRSVVFELTPPDERAGLIPTLVSLVRKGLIRPERSLFAGDDGYRFRHLLIRDAAYESLAKRERAQLHARYAGVCQALAGPRLDEFREILGYHLEQAYRYGEELGPADELAHRELGGEAAEHLAAAGRRALGRTDLPAAINLLERTAAVLPGGSDELTAVQLELATALLEAGRLDDVANVLDILEDEARSRSDSRLAAHAGVERLLLRLQTDTSGVLAEAALRSHELQAAFEAAGDDLGLARLWRTRGLGLWFELRFADAEEAFARGAEHAERAGDERERVDLLCWLASGALHGPTPVDAAIARCDDLRARVRPHLHAEARILHPLAGLHAMAGDFQHADALLDEGNAILHELGLTMHSAVSHSEALVALLAGDAERAERRLREDYDRLERMGEKALFSTTAAVLAQALCAQGRFEEAYAYTETAEHAGAAEDRFTQMRWRAVRARILARRGKVRAAEKLAREATDLSSRTDSINDQADVLLDAADVLRLTGHGDPAALVAEAAWLYERKGNRVSAAAARALLDGKRRG